MRYVLRVSLPIKYIFYGKNHIYNTHLQLERIDVAGSGNTPGSGETERVDSRRVYPLCPRAEHPNKEKQNFTE